LSSDLLPKNITQLINHKIHFFLTKHAIKDYIVVVF
jgi:hypothetical protein